MAKDHRAANDKYLAGFWIMEAADLDVALKLAAEESITTGAPEVLKRNPGTRCRIRAEVFVAGVSGRPRGAPRTTGDDPRCSTWFP
jgi:hypothetical protein